MNPQPFRLFSFKGRTNRGKFWLVFLVSQAILWTAIIVTVSADDEDLAESIGAGAIMGLCFIPLAWVMLATQVKRWHDLNVTGWMVLINAIPIFGVLIAIGALGFMKGTQGPNRFGPDPLSTNPADSVVGFDQKGPTGGNAGGFGISGS